MNRRAAVTSPDTMRMIIEITRYLKASGFTITPPGGGSRFVPQSTPVYVRNDSGEEIPAFACLQATGTTELGGQNYITVDQPVDATGTAGAYLFNGIAPIEIGGFGIAHDGPLCRMLKTGTLASGDKAQPVVGQWAIAAGGDLITIVGDDDIEPDTVRGVIGSNKQTFRFIRFELNEELVGTTASADIVDKDGVSIETGATIEDPETIFTGLTATTRGIGIQEGSRYFIVNANCPAPVEE